MPKISIYEQIIHDQVVAARAQALGALYQVLADPDIIKRTYQHNLYPDIIVVDHKNHVLYLEEVATENSITEQERDKHWLGYTKLGYPFNLIVPRSTIKKTEKLINGLSINKIYYYELNHIEIKFRQIIT